MLFKQYGTGLWAMPHKVDATGEGIEIFQATNFSGDGVRAIAEWPLVITGRDFKPVDSRAKDWSDWTVSFRSFESDSHFMDVTLGEGMPAVWCEFAGVQPVIALGWQQGKGSRGKKAATFFGLNGKPSPLPATGDALGISYEGRSYGVFAPDGTKFAQTDAGIAVTFAGKQEAFEEKEAAKKPGTARKAADIKTLGGELGSYHLGFLMHADASRVVAEIDKLWAEPSDKVAHNEWMTSIYYQASALAELGRVDWTAHGSTPTSMVYANTARGTRTLVAWNPTARPQTVQFFEGSKPLGKLEVQPHSVAEVSAFKQ